MPTLPYIVRVILKTSHFSERTLLLTSGPLVPGGLAEGLQPPFSLKKATLKHSAPKLLTYSPSEKLFIGFFYCIANQAEFAAKYI